MKGRRRFLAALLGAAVSTAAAAQTAAPTLSSPTTPVRCKLTNLGVGTSPCASDSLTHYNLMEDKSRTFAHNEPYKSFCP